MSAEKSSLAEREKKKEDSWRSVPNRLQTGEENYVATVLSACGLLHPQIALIGNGSTATAATDACCGLFPARNGLGYKPCSHPVESKCIKDCRISLVLAAVGDDRGSLPVLAFLLIRVDEVWIAMKGGTTIGSRSPRNPRPRSLLKKLLQ